MASGQSAFLADAKGLDFIFDAADGSSKET